MQRRSFLQLLAATPLALRAVKVLAEPPPPAPAKALPVVDHGELGIKAHPKGWRLGWKSAHYRSWRGMRGWTPITYDDPIGRHLKKYLHKPPRKPFDGLHNMVQHRDVVLCRLPIKVWEDRQQTKQLAKNMVAHQNKEIFGG